MQTNQPLCCLKGLYVFIFEVFAFLYISLTLFAYILNIHVVTNIHCGFVFAFVVIYSSAKLIVLFLYEQLI